MAKLINCIKSEELDIGLLKGCKASIHVKENNHPNYFEPQKIPIHFLPMVVAKLKKMIEQGILEKVTQGCNSWVSPIVMIQKAQWGSQDMRGLQSRCESSDML